MDISRILAASVLSLASVGAVYAQSPAHSHDSELDRAAALKTSQAAVGEIVGDYDFVDGDRRPVRLAELRGRPVVISLIYTSCSHTCPVLTQHLAGAVKIARDALGEDSFSVVSIGFDTAVDSPERMRLYARERGIDTTQWRFLSADAMTIDALSKDLGFIFRRSPKGFDHLAQTTVLDAEGRVYRQVYGEDFDPPSLVEPLKELALGLTSHLPPVSGWIDRVRLFCTLYDPASGRYRFDYSIFVGIAVGIICLGAIAVFVVRAWRQPRPPGSVSSLR